MNFQNLVTSNTGLIHLVFSILALIFGTMVLIQKKGTSPHKKMGYAYAVSMVGVLITAFMIYRLYGKFGIFHWLAVIRTITLLCGMIPVILKKPTNGYMGLHFNFMYWSVFGLYGAFTAETIVRIPDVADSGGIPAQLFYNLVGIAVFITMGIGYGIMKKKKKAWSRFEKQ